MSKKDLGELKNYFKEIYPHIWEHYKFLFDRRTKNRNFEFLIASESLISLIFITLFKDLIFEGKIIFLIPLFAFIISILFSLINLIPKFIWFPWFEKQNLKKVFEIRKNKDFYEEGLRSIYGVLAHVVTLFYYNLTILLFLFIPIIILSWYLIRKGWGKELVLKNPALEVERFFNKWKEEIRNK